MTKAKKPLLADMHTHLNEKKVKPKDWWKFAKQRKLTAIAITEHPNYKPREAYQKLKAIQPKGILLIPGIETKTSAGDILMFGEDETIYYLPKIQQMNVPVEEALKVAKENNLLVSFAHPFGYKYDSACEVIGEEETRRLIKKYNTGIEYYNGMLASANELLFGRKWIKGIYKALEFVEKNKATNALRISKTTANTTKKMEKLAIDTLQRVQKGMIFSKNASFVTVGSDAHYPQAIGTSIIELKRKPKNEKEFLEIIRNGEVNWKGPNIYSKNPVDVIGRKEMLEGLTYLAKKKVLKKRKVPLAGKIKQKISLGKRIKTIKRISNKANLSKIRQKISKIKLKKVKENISRRKITKVIRKKLGL
jgi:predicted metal-dependent phosphoesterase TrpH